jgi:hypothetical protein
MLAFLLGNLFTGMIVRGLSLVVILLLALIEAQGRRRLGVPREGF